MSEYLELMLDNETTGIKPGCGIWQLGVAVSNGEEHLVTINPAAIPGNFVSDSDTIRWQMNKNSDEWEAAHQIVVHGDQQEDMLSTLSSLIDRLREQAKAEDKKLRFWCKGTDFDFPILAYAYEYYCKKVPWKYHECNDFRTLCQVTGSHLGKFPGAHNALEDARHQLAHLLELLELIKRGTHTSIS